MICLILGILFLQRLHQVDIVCWYARNFYLLSIPRLVLRVCSNTFSPELWCLRILEAPMPSTHIATQVRHSGPVMMHKRWAWFLLHRIPLPLGDMVLLPQEKMLKEIQTLDEEAHAIGKVCVFSCWAVDRVFQIDPAVGKLQQIKLVSLFPIETISIFAVQVTRMSNMYSFKLQECLQFHSIISKFKSNPKIHNIDA